MWLVGVESLVKLQPSYSAAEAAPPLEMPHLIIICHLGMWPLHPEFLLWVSLSHLLECSIPFHTKLEGVIVNDPSIGDCIRFLLLL